MTQDKRRVSPSPLRWDAGQSVFAPKVISSTQESNSFVPIYFFTFPEITQYPESNILLKFLAVISLAKETMPHPINKEKATQDVD